MKSPPVYIRVRTYDGGDPVITVHLVFTEGAAHRAVLHGEVGPKTAEELVQLFKSKGIPVLREKCPSPGCRLY